MESSRVISTSTYCLKVSVGQTRDISDKISTLLYLRAINYLYKKITILFFLTESP